MAVCAHVCVTTTPTPTVHPVMAHSPTITYLTAAIAVAIAVTAARGGCFLLLLLCPARDASVAEAGEVAAATLAVCPLSARQVSARAQPRTAAHAALARSASDSLRSRTQDNFEPVVIAVAIILEQCSRHGHHFLLPRRLKRRGAPAREFCENVLSLTERKNVFSL